MKSIYLFCLAVLLFLTSCNDFYFKNPQPLHGKELKAIPDELIGTYLEKQTDSVKDQDKDTLLITRNSYDLRSSDRSTNEMKVSGTLERGKVALKKMDDFYVLSQKVKSPLESSRDSVWEVYILQYKNDVLSLYNLTSEERELKLDSIKQITPVKVQTEGNDKYYLINPSNKQFKKLLISNLYEKMGEFEKVK